MTLNLEFENDPVGPAIWRSNRSDQRDGVLDLVFIEDELVI